MTLELPTQLIGVIGSGECDNAVAKKAYEVGRGIAQTGYPLICGGLGGVMEAACRGAVEAGGITIGVLPGGSAEAANRYVKIPIVTGIGLARNVIIVQSARVLIAIHGGPGTLSEIAYALQYGVPVVSLDSHDVSPKVVQVQTADDAVREAVSQM